MKSEVYNKWFEYDKFNHMEQFWERQQFFSFRGGENTVLIVEIRVKRHNAIVYFKRKSGEWQADYTPPPKKKLSSTFQLKEFKILNKGTTTSKYRPSVQPQARLPEQAEWQSLIR